MCIRDRLNADTCDGLLDPKSLYTVIRKDRVGCRGGGVCALEKRSHSVLPLTFHEKYSELEIVGFDFVGCRPALRIFIVYRPPMIVYARLLTECFTKYTNNHKYAYISLSAILIYPISTGMSQLVLMMIYIRLFWIFFLRNGYSQLVHFPTRGHNLLYLLLTDADMLVAMLRLILLLVLVTMLQSYSE